MSNEERILQLLEAQEKALEAHGKILEGQQDELRKINARLDGVESRLDKLEEHAEITRAGVNSLLEWAEDVSNAIRFPLPRVK